MKIFNRCMIGFIFLNLIAIPAAFCVGSPSTIQNQLARLEISSSGRIGVAAINTRNGQQIRYRSNESFPMQCTSKVIGVAAILKKSMDDDQLLQKRVYYKKDDLTNWSPVTKKHLTDGMTIAELSAAAISYSDNTAMNLLTRNLGGLAGLNAFARSIGDTHFRQDHGWPDESLSSPESKKDSNTPLAMNESLHKLVFGNVLEKSQREMLMTWMKQNTTGNNRIRAGVPVNWIVADKTGTGSYGATNDIAVIWLPKCNPIVVTIFYSNNEKNAHHREDILASATHMIMHFYAKSDQCIKRDLNLS